MRYRTSNFNAGPPIFAREGIVFFRHFNRWKPSDVRSESGNSPIISNAHFTTKPRRTRRDIGPRHPVSSCLSCFRGEPDSS